MPATTTQKAMQFGGTALGWFALVGQLYLILLHRTTSVTETLVRYFSYFTILTNILVAVCFTALLLNSGKFFQKTGTQTAIAVYILVVGLVYNTVLRFLWQPQGLQYWVDELLHTIMPLLYLCHWFLYGSRNALPWMKIFSWLLYPLVYIIYTLIRGSIVHFYPYPFIDVDQKGYPTVLATSLLLTLVFSGFSLLFVAISRWKNKMPAMQ